ncbi:hypothetical protein M9R32_11930 [Paenisporosarcina quisquiliarum]|uniref:Uncharacterized protein n=1 Tax=Paenisporosarcina quisquiliarum TaxID=365346 RepID=A0A9X3LJY7_9BACL|nr:hypothetical protein [Paenisporosarcina quisquiliarum]MCZ8537894.1 hypothetical protein [Paenisporosarcina quisquiliarum]
MIYYLFMGIFIIIASIFVLKNTQIIYLLFKLGFNFDVIRFMIVELLMVALVITILDSFGYTTSSFVISSLILGMFLPAVFETTQKRKPSKISKKKSKKQSSNDYAWSYYGGSGSSDCGDSGGDSGGDGGGSCD